jgi:6-phosphogluconolactonase (cycloisomerase 2 family)
LNQRRFVARLVVCLGLVALFADRAAAGQMGFVYALQQVDGSANQIHGYRIDQTSGELTPLAGFPISSGGTGTGVGGAFSEQLAYVAGKLFVVNNGDNTLTVFSVNAATGALTPMPFSPVALGAGNWGCVTAAPFSGSPVVIGDSLGFLASFAVSDVAATPAPGSPFSTGSARPYSCRFAQGSTQVYAGGSVGNLIAGFGISPTGVLTPLTGSPFSATGGPLAYASDTLGMRLFAASNQTSQVHAFSTLGNQVVQLVPALFSPFLSGLSGAIQGLFHPAGFYMVADRSGDAVGVFQITGSGTQTLLTAVAGSPFLTGGDSTTVIAATGNGAHLVAAHGATRNLAVFAVNQASGVLSLIGTQPANALGTTGGISGLVFAPAEVGFVYSLRQVDGAANQIYGYRINPDTGGLSALAAFPVGAGGTGTATSAAEHMAYHNGRLFVLNDGSDTLSAFKVNRATGALTALPFSPLTLPGGTQGCVAVHPSGSPVVVGNGGTGISSITIGATSAAFAPGSPFTSEGSFSCAFTQDGNYIYTGGNFGTNISALSVNASTGVLTPLLGSPFNAGNNHPAAYAIDSAGRLFTGSLSVSQVRAFTTASGPPAAVSGNPFPAGGIGEAVDGILHPAGFYMVANRSGNSFGVFAIAGSGAGTTLTQVPLSPFSTSGTGATALALTTDGTYLAVANATSRSLSVERINHGTGAPTPILVQPANTLGTTGRLTGIAFVPAVAPFNDDPLPSLPPLSRVIKTTHIVELRSRIDDARAQHGLTPYSYTTPILAPGGTVIQAAHINDLRTALGEIYAAAGVAPPSYTDPVIGSGTIVKAAHIMELRAAVIAIE